MIKRYFPKTMRTQLRHWADRSMDTAEFLVGRQDPLVPPRTMRSSVGYGDFCKHGDEFLRYFVELGGLQPDETVLDVGCGIGRMARPLVKYLSSTAHYEGFDIVRQGIEWCDAHISSVYPNFRFTFADVFNAGYNPSGKVKAAQHRFPYEDEAFDFVFLTSVFTHMLPEDLEHYLSEIARVMKNNGRCLITFFLLNAESLSLIEAGKSSQDFRHVIGECRTVDSSQPENSLAYDEAHVREVFVRYGLHIREPIHFGAWCGREKHLSYQDIVIACKARDLGHSVEL